MKENTVKQKNITDEINIFFKNNIKIIAICSIIVFIINIVDIVTIKYGIDSEHAAILGTKEMFKLSGRYGLYILNQLFPIGSYQVISQILGIIILVISSLMIINKYNFNNSEKILFTILFITYPSIAFMQYYYFQSFYIFFSIFLTVLSYKLLEMKYISSKCLGIIMLFFSLSVFQGNIAVFLAVMMINVILNYLLLNNSFKESIKEIIKTTVILITATIIYFIIQYIVIHFIWNTNDEYHINMIAYTSKNIIDVFGNVLTTIWRIMVSHSPNWEYSAYKYVTIMMFVSLLYYIIHNKNLQKSMIIITYTILFILAIFSLEILLGTWIGSRIDIAVGLYGAMVILVIYHLVNIKYIKNVIFISGILIILTHSVYIIKYQTAYYLTYKQDVITASIILKDLYEECPEIYNKEYKLLTYGKIDNKTYDLLQGKENFGLSQFAFPFEEYRTDYIINFLKLAGLPRHITSSKSSDELKIIADNMPEYPNKGYIKKHDDIVIINLRK